MAEYLTNTTDLTKIASAIREKGGTSDSLVYPDGFVTAIENIQTGGGTKPGAPGDKNWQQRPRYQIIHRMRGLSVRAGTGRLRRSNH